MLHCEMGTTSRIGQPFILCKSELWPPGCECDIALFKCQYLVSKLQLFLLLQLLVLHHPLQFPLLSRTFPFNSSPFELPCKNLCPSPLQFEQCFFFLFSLSNCISLPIFDDVGVWVCYLAAFAFFSNCSSFRIHL